MVRDAPPASAVSPGSLPRLYDPLLTTARLARRIAERQCRGTNGGLNCSWYHGLWPYLRILGVAASPERHQDFFFDVLGSLARSGTSTRVLVSGSADHSMLAHTLRAYRSCEAAPDVTVLDRCETPLSVSSWYARSIGVPISTAASDILSFSCGVVFDVICTHSFLSQFPAITRPALIDKWRQLLRPDGAVVTTTRINPGGGQDGLGFTSEQAEAFSLRVLDEAVRWRTALGHDPHELAAEARRYAERTMANAAGSPQDVVELFEDGGFRVDLLQVREVRGAVSEGTWGPGTNQTATYAEIVARRR